MRENGSAHSVSLRSHTDFVVTRPSPKNTPATAKQSSNHTPHRRHLRFQIRTRRVHDGYGDPLRCSALDFSHVASPSYGSAMFVFHMLHNVRRAFTLLSTRLSMLFSDGMKLMRCPGGKVWSLLVELDARAVHKFEKFQFTARMHRNTHRERQQCVGNHPYQNARVRAGLRPHPSTSANNNR